MINRGEISYKIVTDHWRIVERWPDNKPLRTDILNQEFPGNPVWLNAEIEADDIDKLFLISVYDFGPFSKQTWRIRTTAENFSSGFYDKEHSPRFEWLLRNQETFDTLLVVVSDSFNGPFTLIDGNHRAVVLLTLNRLIGTRIYLGIHVDFKNYSYANQAYKQSGN